MTFVNEFVPEQDVEIYGLRKINTKFWKGDADYRWTIDRDRDIYLRWMTHEREEPGRHDFTFYWKGHLLTIQLTKRGEGVRGGKGSTTWTWWGWQLPDELMVHKELIVADLKDALGAYKEAGIGSTIAEHTAYFEF